MPSSHLILSRPLLLLPPIPPSIRVFCNKSALRIRWPKYWSFSFDISLSNEYSGLIFFRMEWLSILVDNQFSSATQLCPTLCDPMNSSTPRLPVHHKLPEFTQTHVHRVGDAIQPISSSLVPFSSCPQSLPASESFPMSQLFA